MGVECSYSFWDLYKTAFGKEADEALRSDFGKMTQDERNKTVRQWAEKAGWETSERIGSDGLAYTAFAPSFTVEMKM